MVVIILPCELKESWAPSNLVETHGDTRVMRFATRDVFGDAHPWRRRPAVRLQDSFKFNLAIGLE